MGFFSKIKKGFKKVVSKIGRGIKKTVKKVGKFMDKIGIVGQIGLALVLPGIGSMMGGLAGGMMSSSIGVVRGAGQLLNAAVNIGTKATSMFKSVTEGVGKVLGDVVGATLNKIPGAGDLLRTVSGGKIDITSKTFADAWKTTQTAISDVATKGGDLFSMGTLTDPNKYITQAAASAGKAALAGTEGPSTWDDSKLDFLDKSEINIEAGTGLLSPEAGQINLEAAGLPASTPEPWLAPSPVTPEPAAVVKQRGAAIARQGAEAAAAATPAENLGMGEASFYSDALKTDPVLQKGKSLLESGKEILQIFDQARPQQMQQEYEGAGVVDIYGATGIGRERMPVMYQQFEADPTLVQSYAYGAGAAYNNYQKLMGNRYPGMVG